MKLKNLNLNLIKLPLDIEIPVYLIKEELKAQKFYKALSELGCDEPAYRPDFSNVILTCMGFRSKPDDLYKLYFDLQEKHSLQDNDDNSKIMKRAIAMYVALRIEKLRRKEGTPLDDPDD